RSILGSEKDLASDMNDHFDTFVDDEQSEGSPLRADSVGLPVRFRDPAGTRGLVVRTPAPADQQPAMVYLARLSHGSRRTMSASLHLIAGLLTSNRCDRLTLQWGALRYQHTAALRTLLAELYAPATANKMLAALRGVLQEAWRLGQMGAEEYH